MASNRSLTPWLMWLFPLSFFGFQFILRLFPGLILNEFIEKYGITATDFGLFASLYYLGYAGMQIPMAIALDKFGARKVISACAIVCGLATAMFVLLPSWPVALISRFIIGAGSVIGFLGASKVISEWFPKQQYSRLVGLTFSFGLLGAVYGGRPVSQWIAVMGWEQVSLYLAGIALTLGLFCLVFLRDKQSTLPAPTPLWGSMKTLLNNKSILILAFSNLLMVGALEGFADIWGVSYLIAARDLTKMQASGVTSYIFIGMLFGGPILAYFSEKLNAHYGVTILCGVMMSLLLGCILLFNPYFNLLGLKCMMFLLGILCCYQVIVFSIGIKCVPAYLGSLTIAFLNCINMLGGSFFHTLIGRGMDYFAESPSLHNSNYSLETYTLALMVIPLASLAGACLIAMNRFMTRPMTNHNIL